VGLLGLLGLLGIGRSIGEYRWVYWIGVYRGLLCGLLGCIVGSILLGSIVGSIGVYWGVFKKNSYFKVYDQPKSTITQ
jgi:hypothetical protein